MISCEFGRNPIRVLEVSSSPASSGMVAAGSGAIRGMVLSLVGCGSSAMKALAHMAALSAAGLLAVSAGDALGQQSAPTDYKLVAENGLATIHLATEIDSVQHPQLRL